MIAATLALNILGLALPLAVMEVYDSIIPKNAQGALIVLAIGLAAAILMEALLRTLRALAGSYMAARFEARSIAVGFAALLSRSGVEDETVARRMARLRSISRVADFHHGPLRWAFLDLAFVPVFFLLIAMIGGQLAILLAGLLALFMWLHHVAAERFAHAAARLDAEAEKTQDFIAECLAAVPQIKAQAAEAFVERRLERLAGGSARLSERLFRAAADSEKLAFLMGGVTLVAMAGAGGALAVGGGITAGGVIACMLLVSRVVQPALRAASAMRAMRDLERFAQDADALLTAAPAVAAKPALAPAPELVVQGLSADGAGCLTLTFEAPAGTIAAVCDAPPAARSALLRALAGLSAPASGQAMFGGAAVEAIAAAGEGRIVLVTAESTLFAGSILDNLTLFGRGPSVEDVDWACKLIGLDVEIARLPNGYLTAVGEDVSGASPASLVRQITLARAIAMRPALLVLDEPQAHLDQRADAALLRGLKALAGEMTIVIGSERPSYAAIAGLRVAASSATAATRLEVA